MTKPSWQDFGTHDESAYPELWDGVVGAWAPCLGPTGSRLHDMSRRANWGTLTNMDPATDWVVSDGQYALDFDGSNDYVATTNTMQMLDFTVSVWFRPTTVNLYNRLVDKNFSTGFWTGRNFDGGSNWGGGILESNPPYGHYLPATLGQWNFLCMSRAGSLKSVFVATLGGSLASVTATVSTNALSNSTVLIGFASDNSNNFSGRADDVLLWNRALTTNEIRQLYQLGRGGMYQRRRRRAIYLPQAGFQAAWALRRSQIIGGGLR